MGDACSKPDQNVSEKPKRQTQQREVNPFKPGPRDVRIVQNEDGKLEKTKYKPPSDPTKAKQEKEGEAQSLVTYSMMQAQTETKR